LVLYFSSQPQEEDAQRKDSHDDGENQVWNTLVQDDAKQRQHDAQECQNASQHAQQRVLRRVRLGRWWKGQHGHRLSSTVTVEICY
jgi:hypothetical protein